MRPRPTHIRDRRVSVATRERFAHQPDVTTRAPPDLGISSRRDPNWQGGNPEKTNKMLDMARLLAKGMPPKAADAAAVSRPDGAASAPAASSQTKAAATALALFKGAAQGGGFKFVLPPPSFTQSEHWK